MLNELKSISFCTEKIKSILEYGSLADFNAAEERINDDMFKFIYEYCSDILSNKSSLKVKVENDSKYFRSFSPQNIGVILENLYSNSVKNDARNFTVKLSSDKEFYYITAIDDGTGLDEMAKKNVDKLFEFGKSYTFGGTGIGLFHINEIVKKMSGTVKINTLVKKGFEIEMRFKK